jgi:FMN phosphatase YigB (HAD superfamily)
MSLTVLLDLDDTLLINPTESFVAAYLQALSLWLAEYAPPEAISQALLSGTRRMTRNAQPGCTLREVFDSEFYPALGVSREAMQAEIDRFYEQGFPALLKIAHPAPGAVATVDRLFAMGAHLAIATNPLFPLTAIRQRLEWAGLDPQRYPFEIIPSYETFHFAKPDPAFLAELLGRMGWPEGGIVMVGDSLKHDAPAARGLGVPFYHVRAEGEPDDESPGGRLPDLPDWLAGCAEDDLQVNYEGIPAILAGLRATPAVLAHWFAVTPQADQARRPADDSWSLSEAMCHLRDVEGEVYLPRLAMTLGKENPFLQVVDTDQWAEQRGYRQQDGLPALERFCEQRMESLRLLQPLSAEDWQRPARHPILGNTTVREMAEFSARHDRLHLHDLYSAGIIH